MLNNLRRPTGEVFRVHLPVQGLILHLDGFISLTLTWAAEKRQTAFLGIVRTILLDDLGVEHHGIRGSPSALVEKGDDALAHTNHIRRHANAGFLVRHQRVKQGMRDSKRNGTQIGLQKGTALVTKKSIQCKEIIKKHSRDFGGSLDDPDVIKLCGRSRNSYYKYKREFREQNEIDKGL